MRPIAQKIKLHSNERGRNVAHKMGITLKKVNPFTEHDIPELMAQMRNTDLGLGGPGT